jgi:hypothetical protein
VDETVSVLAVGVVVRVKVTVGVAEGGTDRVSLSGGATTTVSVLIAPGAVVELPLALGAGMPMPLLDVGFSCTRFGSVAVGVTTEPNSEPAARGVTSSAMLGIRPPQPLVSTLVSTLVHTI